MLIWKESMDLVEQIYLISDKFPKTEQFGLSSQIRRSAVSIPSNIAEGAGRNSDPEMKRFLHYAMGSIYELNTQLMLASRIGYINNEDAEKLEKRIEQIVKMMQNFKNQLPV